MAKQIVVLNLEPGDPQQIVHYVMWLPVPLAYQPIFLNAAATSMYKGVSPAELVQLQSGQVVEFVGQTMIQPGWTVTDIKTELIRNYSLQVNVLSATTAQYLRYGVSWDGTTWSV